MIQFFDELANAPVPAQNPLPAGILVTVMQQYSALPVGTAYTSAGGLCDIENLVPQVLYTASFYGTRAPLQPVTFTAESGTTTVIVPNYRSPSLSTAGYQLAQAELFPLERVDTAELLPGGILYNIQTAHGSVLANLDQQVQVVLGAERLDSSTGSAIDSWANDFIGQGLWYRAPGETDSAYIARIKLWLSLPFGTIYAVQTIIDSYLTAFDLVSPSDDPGTLNSVIVFDTQSNPTLAAAIGLNPLEAQFCILYEYALVLMQGSFFLNQTYMEETTYLGGVDYYASTPLNSYFAQLVNTVKLAGSQPVYFSTSA